MLKATTALLQALLSGDGYGLQLQQRVRDATGGVVLLNPGNLYPALRSMQVEGLVNGRDVDASEGGRQRIVYSLTRRGRLRAEAERKALRALLGA